MNSHTTTIAPADIVDVVVIGEGITGLSAAVWLQQAGARVCLLAAKHEPGGAIKTVRENGFLCEAGATTVMPRGPEFMELVRLCGIEKEILFPFPSASRLYVMRDEILHRVPTGLFALLGSNLFSATAKFRLLREPFIAPSAAEESVAQFITRRLGKEFLDYAIEPLLPGTMAGQVERLSVRATLPQLQVWERQYGSIAQGIIRARFRNGASIGAPTYARGFTFREGMETLPKALSATLGPTIRFNAQAVSIKPVGHSKIRRQYLVSYRKNGRARLLQAKEVLLAVPAHEASRLLKRISRKTANVLESIPYESILSVFFGFRRGDIGRPLDGFGYFVPAIERKSLLGCFWNSSQYRGRAPAGAVAMSVLIGGASQQELLNATDSEAAVEACSEISRTMQIHGKPVYLHTTRWASSIPQYELGHEHRMEQLRDFEMEYPGITLAGSYRKGISLGARVEDAHRIAGTIAARLLRSSTTR